MLQISAGRIVVILVGRISNPSEISRLLDGLEIRPTNDL
jgi:hypothetical protein